MTKKSQKSEILTLQKIVGGGQALGTLESGKKVFAWGGLPGEKVNILITKNKSSMAEGIVDEVIDKSADRVEPRDPDNFLSTSPWQIMNFEMEQKLKSDLIDEAFEMHHIKLAKTPSIYSDNNIYEYRNKMEYSFWYEKSDDQLHLAFFRRGSHGKIIIDKSSLASPAITAVSGRLLEILRQRKTEARDLKTALIRSSQKGYVAVQLYVKEPKFEKFSDSELDAIDAKLIEIIYSNPKSPASVISHKIQSIGENLDDDILGINFNYSTEGFFQVNIAVYEKALKDMKDWVLPDKPTIDLYSGVGTIGLTIGNENVSLIEINESAVNEMKRNIKRLSKKHANAILAPSEKALDYLSNEACIIVDPPRAGLHDDVVTKLLEVAPQRIIYLSCNPTTQARDVEKLLEKYEILHQQGYNFFPRTPHIENLIVLDTTIA